MKETTGSLTANAAAVAADNGRDGLVVSNTSDTVMTYRPGGTATAAIGMSVAANDTLVVPKPFIRCAGTLFCAGTSKTYVIYEA